MKPVAEIIAKFVYPSIRKALVEILYKEYNLTQQEIAKKTYITQSAVSRYIRGSRGNYLDIRKAEETYKELVQEAKRIAEGNLSRQEIEKILMTYTLKALGRGDICKFHSQIDPAADPKTCNICKDLFKNYVYMKS